MFFEIKRRYSNYLFGVSVFIFIGLFAYSSYASVCFLPTGNCVGESGALDTSDDLPAWCEDGENCDNPVADSYTDIMSASILNEKCAYDKKYGCYRIINSYPEKEFAGVGDCVHYAYTIYGLDKGSCITFNDSCSKPCNGYGEYGSRDMCAMDNPIVDQEMVMLTIIVLNVYKETENVGCFEMFVHLLKIIIVV